MTDDDHARVRCYAEDKSRLNDLKHGDDTQADVIRRLLDGAGHDGTDGPFPDVTGIGTDAVPEEVREQLDRIEASAATVEERTNQIQRDVEDLGGGR
jgi:hypothetical protein